MLPSLTFPSARFYYAWAVAAVAICLLNAEARAQKVDQAKLDAASRRSLKAAKVLTDLSALPPAEAIPRELLEKAKAVAVFPDVDRVNLLFIKAMKGYGLMSRRLPDGWGTPAFYGFAVTDRGWTLVKPANAGIIMLFMDDEILKRFEKDHIEFEGVAGPVGAPANEKEMEKVSKAGIIIYALSDGKLHGIEVKDDYTTQTGINSDNNINKAVYGLKAREVLWGKTPPATSAPPAVTQFQNALASLLKQ